jgi:ATP-binding cassette subfamily B (MDR/TAP) protein 1
MAEEMESLHKNNTWELVECPKGAKPVPVKWVFKIKRDATGNIERFKARLVAKGYKRREGIDFTEFYAPVSKHSTLRALLAIAAVQDLDLKQLDTKTAFLNGELEEEIYMVQLPGFEEGGKSVVCKLKKALYGLRQAPRAWYSKRRTGAHGIRRSGVRPRTLHLPRQGAGAIPAGVRG